MKIECPAFQDGQPTGELAGRPLRREGGPVVDVTAQPES
jgi:hypothetical protein